MEDTGRDSLRSSNSDDAIVSCRTVLSLNLGMGGEAFFSWDGMYEVFHI